jgi:hypothetical protein
LEAVTIAEPATGKRYEERTVALRIRLLGSFHDGYLEFEYPRVFRYEVRSESVLQGHGDWLYDEFRVGEAGQLIHEIEWASGSRWLIEASDVAFKWLPGSLDRGAPDPDA